MKNTETEIKETWYSKFLEYCKDGNVNLVQTWLCYGKKIGIESHHCLRDGFNMACQKGHLDLVIFFKTEEFRNLGFKSVNIHELLEWEGVVATCREGRLEVIRFLTTSEDLEKTKECINLNQYPFCFRSACEGGHLELIQFLTTDENLKKLERSLSLKDWGWHGFFYACKEGHLRVVQWLVQSLMMEAVEGIRVDSEGAEIQGLEVACENDHWNVVAWLILESNLQKLDQIEGSILDRFRQVQELLRIREESVELQQSQGDNEGFVNALTDHSKRL